MKHQKNSPSIGKKTAAADPIFSGKAITRADVAKLAGVSLPAVSQVLNNTKGHRISEKTQEKVKAAAEELGYRPSAMARAIKTGRTENIGVLLCNYSDFINEYNGKALVGAWELFHKKSYRLLIDTLPEDGDASVMFRDKVIDALLLVAPHHGVKKCSLMIDNHFPVVCIGNRTLEETHYSDVDNYQAGLLMGNAVLEAGHKDILVLCGPVSEEYCNHSMSSAQERLEGILSVFSQAGIEMDPNRIVHSEYTGASSAAALQAILKKKTKFTAIIAASDGIAEGAEKTLKNFGLSVPDDVSIICVSARRDDRWSCVYQDIRQIGRNAANIILRQLSLSSGSKKLTNNFVQGVWNPGKTLRSLKG